jgi:hypothetical protein
MSEREIYACWRKHDDKRTGKSGPGLRTAIDDAAEELGIPCYRVREVVAARLRWIAT